MKQVLDVCSMSVYAFLPVHHKHIRVRDHPSICIVIAIVLDRDDLVRGFRFHKVLRTSWRVVRAAENITIKSGELTDLVQVGNWSMRLFVRNHLLNRLLHWLQCLVALQRLWKVVVRYLRVRQLASVTSDS